jgi:hypothetical protein
LGPSASASRRMLHHPPGETSGPHARPETTCGFRALGIARTTAGPGPRVAGRSPPSAGPPGSRRSTGVKEEPTATSRDIGPTSAWRKARTTAAGTGSTVGAQSGATGTSGTIATKSRDHRFPGGIARPWASRGQSESGGIPEGWVVMNQRRSMDSRRIVPPRVPSDGLEGRIFANPGSQAGNAVGP